MHAYIAGRQAGRQADRQTDRQTDIHTYMNKSEVVSKSLTIKHVYDICDILVFMV
jgi:hypothetical protein